MTNRSCIRLRPAYRTHIWRYDFVHRRTHEGRAFRTLTLFIEPGSLWKNGDIKPFRGKVRDELLDREIFDTLPESKVLIGHWRVEYNTMTPQSSPEYRPPAPAADSSDRNNIT